MVVEGEGEWIGHWRVPTSFCGACFFFSWLFFLGFGPLGTEEKEQHTKQIEHDLLEEVLFENKNFNEKLSET